MSSICSAAELAERLQGGEAALFPTDTLPALATRPDHAALLWQLKQRPRQKPVILMAAQPEALWCCLGIEVRPEWQTLAQAHWPGALTLVLPAKGPVVEQLNPGGGSLGLRIPDCRQALALLERSGALATTSANRSGEPPCLDAAQAATRFPGVAQLGPTPWPEASGLGSTVLAWKGEGWQLLRAGGVMPADLPIPRP